MGTSKIIAVDKNVFNVGIKVTNIASVDVIFMILVYMDMFSGNDLRNKK